MRYVDERIIVALIQLSSKADSASTEDAILVSNYTLIQNPWASVQQTILPLLLE